MKSKKSLPQSISHSVLCHVSVGRWCAVSGYASGSPERSERCARLTGDVAAMTAKLLNAYFYEGGVRAAESVAKVRLSATTASCRVCHFKGKDYEAGQFTRGYLECEACHRDMTPHAHLFFNPVAASASLKQETVGVKQLKETSLASIGLTGVMGAITGFLAGASLAKTKQKSKTDKEG